MAIEWFLCVVWMDCWDQYLVTIYEQFWMDTNNPSHHKLHAFEDVVIWYIKKKLIWETKMLSKYIEAMSEAIIIFSMNCHDNEYIMNHDDYYWEYNHYSCACVAIHYFYYAIRHFNTF